MRSSHWFKLSAVVAAHLLISVAFGSVASADTPTELKQNAITVMNAHLRTLNLSGANRTGIDPYSDAFDAETKIQTESTAMALHYGGVANLGWNATQLQEVYDYFSYMADVDGWLYSDYTPLGGRVFKKGLHNAWSLAALDILVANGIADTNNLRASVRDAVEGALDANGYMAGDPDGNEGLRTKFVQSLPFFFKVAQDTSDAAAVAKARQSIDFYMANCIDGNFDVWRTDATGAKVLLINTHEVMEFAHGLQLFYEYETDATRKATIQTNLTGILTRYSGSNWSFTNSFGEIYLSDAGAAGTVNTLAHFQMLYILEFAARNGWMASGIAEPYLAIAGRIKMSGFGDPERDNNYFYQAHPDTGAQISANINSYEPGYQIAAIDALYKTISGTVTDGGALAGVTVSADAGGGSDVSDGSGEYALLVPTGWSGSVTPSLAEYTFAPPNRAYVNVLAHDPGEDYAGTYTPDLTAPNPDPLTWSSPPSAASPSSISMTATTATDALSGPVEYFFECTNDAGASSSWQASPTYVANGLSENTLYSFRVKARDAAAALNETGYSATESATTPLAPPEVVQLGTWQDGAFPGYSHVAPAGNDRVLVVMCHAEANAAPTDFTAVTYGGQALTQVVERLQNQTSSFGATAEIWILDEAGIQAAAGSTIVVTSSGAAETRRVSSIFYSGVDQADPTGQTGTDGENANEAQTLSVALSGGELDAGDRVVANSTVRNDQSGNTTFTWQNGLAEIGGYTPSGSPYLTYSGADLLADGTAETATVDILNNGVGALAVTVLNHKSAPVEICGNGVLEGAEQCDDGNLTDGDCCSSTCTFESAATVCRASAGTCDVAETCTGSSGSCPVDGFESAATVCRGVAGICDVEETCSGVDAACPADDYASAAVVCRVSAGACDVTETCSGAGAFCPSDGFVAAATECRAAAGACDVAEACTGSDAACPTDGFVAAATECRGVAGDCDVAEACTGADAACPADGFEPPTTTCRPAVGACDATELCTGSTASCPADDVLDGVACADGDLCNGDEVCVVGVCTPGSALNCDDADACTADSCDAVNGCFNDPIPACGTPVPVIGATGHVLLALLMSGFGCMTALWRRRAAR